MIRVLQLIPTLDRSGSEKQLTLLAKGLPRDEFEVRVACLTRGGPYQEQLAQAGIPVTILRKSLKLDPLALWKLRQLLREYRPQILHTWLAAANGYGRIAARGLMIPVVVATERCSDEWKSPWHLRLDRWLAGQTTRVVVNSRGVADFYRRHGIAQEKIVVIYNGVELVQPADEARRAQVRRQLGIPCDAHVVGFVGRLAAQKRVMDLIWAADILKVILPDVYLLIIGDGPQRARLQQFTRDCQMRDRVFFLGHREDVAPLRAAMDVAWLGSSYEGMPNALMEAMAAGLPVVASNVSGTNELMKDTETGFLVPVGDRAALAQRTFQLFEDPARARRMGENGRRRVAEQFTVQRMIDEHVRCYRALLEEQGMGEVGTVGQI